MDENINWGFNVKTYNESLVVPKSSPIIHGNSILFGSDSGNFICLDKNTGAQRWYYNSKINHLKGILSSPAVSQGVVYYGAYNGVLYAIQIESGHELWKRKYCNWIGSSPLIVGDILYVGLEFNGHPGGALIAIDKETTEIIWSFPLDNHLHGSPIYSKDNDVIIIGTNDQMVYALDASTGEELQSCKTMGDVKYHAALKGNVAVFGCTEKYIYFWNYITGEMLHREETEGSVYTRPLIVDDFVYVGSGDHNMRIIDMKNYYVDKIMTGGPVFSSPSLIDGSVFFGSCDGWVYEIVHETKEALKHTYLGQKITTSIVADDSNLFVYTHENRLFSIKRVT
jgi:outer membrane protein assembly factor BamB